MKWFVLYTKPQFEIRVSKALNAIGINAYCPTYNKIVQYSDRKKKVEKPLLPSYVLVNIAEQDRSKVFLVTGVLRYVFWLGKPAQVYEKEIKALKNSLKGIIESFSIRPLQRGTEYTIQSGPFKGHNGKVLAKEKNKLKLQLKELGMLVTLTVY